MGREVLGGQRLWIWMLDSFEGGAAVLRGLGPSWRAYQEPAASGRAGVPDRVWEIHGKSAGAGESIRPGAPV